MRVDLEFEDGKQHRDVLITGLAVRDAHRELGDEASHNDLMLFCAWWVADAKGWAQDFNDWKTFAANVSVLARPSDREAPIPLSEPPPDSPSG